MFAPLPLSRWRSIRHSHYPYPVIERIIPALASYHLQVKTISRADGRSSIAAAAYRSAELIYCDREGRSHDYTRKRGVEHLQIVSPESAPEWVQDRASLWNHAEAAEKRKNAVTAREWEIALPAELDAEDRKALALTFANDLVARFGVVADVAVHAPHRDGDQRNHHAHILTTTRRIEADGFTVKTRELDNRKLGSQNIIDMREHWANLQNQALERAGSIDRVDHRSLEAQREEAEQERDQLQERVTELESVIDGYAMQLVEPDNLERWNGMLSFDVNREWHNVEQAERERKTLEKQLQAQTFRAAELDRVPQIKLGPSASAMERKGRRQAELEDAEYEPATDRGAGAMEAQQQLSFVEDARERFDAACAAYSEARELGFSRTRSAYEAAREALLFGVEQETEKPTLQHHLTQVELSPLRGIGRLKARRQDREQHQKQEQERGASTTREREPEREASVWDALDEIGREQASPCNPSTTSDAMQRIQDQSEENHRQREAEEKELERQKLEREQKERDLDHGLDFSF